MGMRTARPREFWCPVVSESVLIRLTRPSGLTRPTGYFVQCNQVECQNPIRFGRNYLEVDGPPESGEFRFIYVSRCGVWIQTSEGDQGDIAC